MIQRYSLDRCCDGCSLSRDPEGDWVDIEDAAKLEADCKRYREALGFYADPDQWERQVSAESSPYCLSSPVSNDMGSIARKTLREAESYSAKGETPLFGEV